MPSGAPRRFGAQLKALREAAGFTQEELATIAGLSVHAVSALERGQRRRPHPDTVRALSTALDLTSLARDAFIASARPPAPAAAVEESSGGWIPMPLTSLVGREADIRILRQWIADPSARLITLVGPGGAGKTRLALELAHATAAMGTTRVEFVALAAIRDAAFVGPAIAEALGLADVAVPDLPKRARVACEGRATLMVLDNFEQVLDAASLVVDLLATVTTLRLLVTSRAPLHIRGEREYAVGPLALEAAADALPPSDLARCPAVHLFLDRVRDTQPQFELTAANAPTIAAICRRVDSLPLALELAAPWMKVLAPEDLRRRLDSDVLLSAALPRDLPGRQQTMNAAVAWSYQLLNATEQRTFRRFGALPGLFPINAAAAVLAGGEAPITERDALIAAASLIDKSLLVRSESTMAPTGPRYYMLETVRAFAVLQLAASDERDDAMEGLVRYCSDEAARALEGLRGPAQVEWLDRVREDLESYRAALAWLIEHRRHAEAANIAYWLRYFWLIRGHAAEGLKWYERILREPSLPPLAESRALFGAAGMWWTQGELERGRTGLQRVLFLAPQAGDLETVAQAEHVSGHVEHALGNVASARDHFARSIELFRTLAIPSGMGNALSGMAVVALATGDHAEAERLLGEATTVLRHAGPWFLTWALYVRSVLAVRRTNPTEALALLRESLARIRDLHDRFALVYALVPLAAAAVLKGEDAWAARIIGARHAVTERTGATVADDSVRDLWEHAERQAREHLGADRWAKAYAAGRMASIDSLLKEIDSKLG
jgi:predicted ATPase/DNA-binding XRE family transcriptional regulator